jgi:hypothetical protein
MSKKRREQRSTVTRVELKYCEHCGALWVRESGTGVYCRQCEPKVADLPVPKKPRRLILPEGLRSQLANYGDVPAEDSVELEGVGGVA